MSIKVCGLGVVSSLGLGCDENFDSLMQHRCGIGPLTHWASSVDVPVGEVHYSNDELKRMLNIDSRLTISRTALLGAVAAREAVASAQIPQGKRLGLISSTSVGGMDLSEEFYREFMVSSSRGSLREVVGHDCAASTDFIATQCGISGFRTTISTACSSAANAVIMGAQMLRRGMLDYVVVGGTDALSRFTLNGFNSLMILDSELCRPLDRDRKGLNLGEGAGYIVLTLEENPTESLCRLVGYANANDAYHQTASSPDGVGDFLAMEAALAMSALEPQDIDYINLHGTGTSNNDSSEFAALGRIFGGEIPACSSTKSFTGHTLAASGGIEAVYSVMAIARRALYGSLRFENPIEEVGVVPILESCQGVEVGAVMSNSFGFGGNCSSLIFAK